MLEECNYTSARERQFSSKTSLVWKEICIAVSIYVPLMLNVREVTIMNRYTKHNTEVYVVQIHATISSSGSVLFWSTQIVESLQPTHPPQMYTALYGVGVRNREQETEWKPVHNLLPACI